MKQLNSTILALILALLTAQPTYADKAAAHLNVSVFVDQAITSSVSHQEASLIVTPEDVRRGYVEVAAGTVMDVRSNSRTGYCLVFEGMAGAYPEVIVTDRERAVRLPAGTGMVCQSSAQLRGEEKVLSYKFVLGNGVAPGVYPWPLNTSLMIN